MAWLKSFFVVCCLLQLPSQVLANIGEVISVKQGAEVTRSGKSQPLKTGMRVESGDLIATNRTGLVQLIFADETKIAIGPNARMTLDVTMLRSNRKAKSFAVQALGGSFRFISGKSKKRAYSIKTPTATMAVRGTTFDFWVVPGTQSAMLVLRGRVEMCGLNGSCRETGRRCSLYATTKNNSIGQPVDQDSYESALKDGFPFVQSQEQLLTPLRVEFSGCGKDVVPPPQRSETRASEPNRADRPDRPERSAAAESRSESPASGRGNGGNIGGSGGSGNGNGGNIGASSGSGDGRGGSIGGGTGKGGPGSGGTIGSGSDGFGSGPSSGGKGGNGGNS